MNNLSNQNEIKQSAMIDLCDFSNDEEFQEWLYTDHQSPLTLTEENYQLAYEFVMNGWLKRAEEKNLAIPTDLTGSCKFSSLFIKFLFGGEIQGNYDHQYNFINDILIDLNQDAQDVKEMKHSYEHDDDFFGSEDHCESLRSCIPRVMDWVESYKEYKAIPRASKVKI